MSQSIEQCKPKPSKVYFDQPKSGAQLTRNVIDQEAMIALHISLVDTTLLGIGFRRVTKRSIATVASWVIDARLTQVVRNAFKTHPVWPQSHLRATADKNPSGAARRDSTKLPMARLKIRTSFGCVNMVFRHFKYTKTIKPFEKEPNRKLVQYKIAITPESVAETCIFT